MQNVRVFVGVTAYNDPVALVRLLNSLMAQSFPLFTIMIVDNSHDSLFSVLSPYVSAPDTPLIEYQHCPDNPGLGGALKLILEEAKKKSADYVWLFDQDSCPEEDALEKLMTFASSPSVGSGGTIGIYASLPKHSSHGNALHGLREIQGRLVPLTLKGDEESYDCDAVITAGMLIVLRELGGVQAKEDFFLDMVDYEFCLQMRDKGKRVVVVCSSVIRHAMGNPLMVKIPCTKSRVFVPNYSPIRWYYYTRNQTYLETHRSPHYLKALIIRLAAVRSAFKDALFTLQAMKLYAALKGIFDGATGRLGKRW